MQVNSKDLAFLAVGVAFTVLVAYVAHNEAGPHVQPRYEETSDTRDNPSLGFVIDRLDTGDHYFHPNYCVPGQTQIFTPHRYPDTAGPNITALIHHGMDAMRRKAPQDDDWRTMPPGEVMW